MAGRLTIYGTRALEKKIYRWMRRDEAVVTVTVRLALFRLPELKNSEWRTAKALMVSEYVLMTSKNYMTFHMLMFSIEQFLCREINMTVHKKCPSGK